MSTCRTVVIEALRSLKALAPGDDMTVDESSVALECIQNLLLDLHEMRGAMRDVDVEADYTASENERVRVQNGDTVTITLPNAISKSGVVDPYDYGFANPYCIPVGTTAVADGVTYRAPRDGTRIEIVGTTQALYFYRSDLNSWVQASGLTLDSAMPLNARYQSALGALVAERLIEAWPSLFEPTHGLGKRVARANSSLLIRPGVQRDPVVSQAF